MIQSVCNDRIITVGVSCYISAVHSFCIFFLLSAQFSGQNVQKIRRQLVKNSKCFVAICKRIFYNIYFYGPKDLYGS